MNYNIFKIIMRFQVTVIAEQLKIFVAIIRKSDNDYIIINKDNKIDCISKNV